MRPKKWCLAASMLMLAVLTMGFSADAAEPDRTYRQENGLQVFEPPAWFLEGYFIAREKMPVFIFGTVRDFVAVLGGATTWLIEDLELTRLEKAGANVKMAEYSLFLEVVLPERTQYWVFVVLPHESAVAWFDARRAFHGSKAQDYYGKTQLELETALKQGLKINAELRFLIEQGNVSLQVPEDVIMNRYHFQSVFDLGLGRRLEVSPGTR